MIEIRNLCKNYGRFAAVRDLSLEVPDGQVVGLLGPNGAGKSTTIRILTSYMAPTSGSVRVDGFDSVTQSHEVRRRLGYLPESNPLYPEMRVSEYLDFRGRLFKMPRTERRKAIEHVIERCWLGEMRQRLIGRLSKGYRQRVGLAAAMLHSPPVLVLDEPTSGLDPVQIRETRKLIRELAGDHTMILSSHILPEIERTCDRVIIMARGRIRADGTVAKLRRLAAQEARYTVELQGDADEDFVDTLLEMKSIEEVRYTEDGPWTRYEITTTTRARDLREPIGMRVQKTKRLCREISRDSVSLEQLFIRVTSDETLADEIARDFADLEDDDVINEDAANQDTTGKKVDP